METLGRSYQAARTCLGLSVWTQSFVLPSPNSTEPFGCIVTCCLLAGPHISTPLNFVHGVLWPACPFPLLALKSLTHTLRLCKYSTPTNASLIGLFPSSAQRFVSALVLLPAVTMHLIGGVRVCTRVYNLVCSGWVASTRQLILTVLGAGGPRPGHQHVQGLRSCD